MSVIYQKLIITVEKEKKTSVIYQKLITILLCHGFEPVPGIRTVVWAGARYQNCRVKETRGKGITQIYSLTTDLTIYYNLQVSTREKDPSFILQKTLNQITLLGVLGRCPL